MVGGKGHTPPSEKLNVACIGVGGQGAYNVHGLSSQNLRGLRRRGRPAGGEDLRGVSQGQDVPRLSPHVGPAARQAGRGGGEHARPHAFPPRLHGPATRLAPLPGEAAAHTTFGKPARSATCADEAAGHPARRPAAREDNMHRIVELVQSGAIGEVREVHSWIGGTRGMPGIPATRRPCPRASIGTSGSAPASTAPTIPPFCPYELAVLVGLRFGRDGQLGLSHPRHSLLGAGLEIPDQDRGPRSRGGRPADADGDGSDVPVSGPRRSCRRCASLVSCRRRARRFFGTRPEGERQQHVVHRQQGDAALRFRRRQLLPKDKFADFQAPAAARSPIRPASTTSSSRPARAASRPPAPSTIPARWPRRCCWATSPTAWAGSSGTPGRSRPRATRAGRRCSASLSARAGKSTFDRFTRRPSPRPPRSPAPQDPGRAAATISAAEHGTT